MEPRPQKPNRSTGPFISTGTPSPSQSSGTGGFGQPAYDASSAPPAPPPAIGYDPDYSPGQPLTPLRGPRGANIVGPLLAVAALAIIVAAVAFIVSQFRENGGGDNKNAPTAVVAVVDGSPTETTDQGATSEETPTTEDITPADDAKPTRTPKVSRPTTDPNEDLDATEVPTDEPSNTGEKTKASQWFPKESDIGGGFVRTDNGTRTEEEVVASFPVDQQADAPGKLADFGWQENAYREYSNDSAASSETSSIIVSIHRFKTEKGASDALEYFVNGAVTAQGLTTLEDADAIGEESITIQGAIEGGNAYVIYFRKDNFIFRISGFSVAGDPAVPTTDVAKLIGDE